jgi:hypothetical protein
MNKLRYYLAVFFISILVYSCGKEYSDESGTNLLPAGWTNTEPASNAHPARVLLNNLQPADIRFTFDNATGSFLPVTPFVVTIPNNCFVKMDNSPVTGNVEVSIIKASKFSEMMLYNLATVTNNGLLSTDGMMKISAKKGTDPIKIAPGKTISLVFPKSGNNNYQGFAGVENNTTINNITWSVNNQWQVDSMIMQGGGTTLFGTRIQIDSMQWVNCDYFYNQPNPTNLYLKIPSGYGNANTICYAVFRTDKVITGLRPDVLNQRFWQGASYRVPIGKSVRLVAVSKKDNKNYYGHIDVTISADMTATITSMEEVSDAELQIRLNAL